MVIQARLRHRERLGAGHAPRLRRDLIVPVLIGAGAHELAITGEIGEPLGLGLTPRLIER